MARFIKQLLYGLLFLAIFSGTGYAAYIIFFAPSECELDPGRPGCVVVCEICELKLESEAPLSFPTSELASALLVKIKNPSLNYGVSELNYSLKIFSRFGPELLNLRGRTSIYPNEEKFIIRSGINVNHDDIGKVDFSYEIPIWQEAAGLAPRPEVGVESRNVRNSQGSVIIEGSLNNRSGQEIRDLVLQGIGYDAEGKIAGASTSTVLLPPGLFDYRIYLPELNYARTEVFIEFPAD